MTKDIDYDIVDIMSKKYYTGVGSRETPDYVLDFMGEVASILLDKGYILRSGHAPGADMAFERGVDVAANMLNLDPEDHKEIWMPWKGFNGGQSNLFPTEQAYSIASTIHPVWGKLKDSHKALHARNVPQVLGKTLNRPSTFTICWTEGGEPKGGTRTAIMVSKKFNVPVLNLGRWSNTESIREATGDFLMLIGEEYDI